MSVEERFWAKVDKSGGDNACWLWTGFVDQDGYGRFRMRASESNGGAHRASWRINVGEIPAGAQMCHICDNPPCVNPRHLYVGDSRTNAIDRQARNLAIQGRPKHHGEGTPFHKLKLHQVREIRRRYEAGGITKSALAREFGVAHSTIGQIVRGLSWRHDH